MYINFPLQDLFNDYECECGEGFFGRHCENVTDPGLNGGDCVDSLNIIFLSKCIRAPGFSKMSAT